MRNIASDRLQYLLNYWKETCWYFEALFLATNNGRPLNSIPDVEFHVPMPVLNWRKYGSLVFDNDVQSLELTDWFVLSEHRDRIGEFDALGNFPFEFFAWSRKSRRVFELPEDLCLQFASGKYPNTRWRDVHLPFDSFIITLEKPIVVEDKEGVWSEYDTILVSKNEVGNINCRILHRPHDRGNGVGFAQRAAHRVHILFKRAQFRKAEQYLQTRWKEWGKELRSSPGWRTGTMFNPIKETPDDLVCLELKDLARRRMSLSSKRKMVGGLRENLWRVEINVLAEKIIVGWCLYLRFLSATSINWNDQKRQSHRVGQRGVSEIITQVDHICTLLNTGRIDPAAYGLVEHESKGYSGFFKRPHWRRKHWRRPRGSPRGSPKIVEVPSALIRSDLVPRYGIVGGTKTKVISEE